MGYVGPVDRRFVPRLGHKRGVRNHGTHLSLFGWLGGVFFVHWGVGGTVAMVAELAVLAAVLAAVLTVVALRPQPRRP